MKPSSVTLYDGPSLLNGSPILAIATGLRGTSKNPKTGNAVQIWIIQRDMHPVDAIHSGADTGICGDCKLRARVEWTRNRRGRFTGRKYHRACYVNPMSVISVWRGWTRGNAPAVSWEEWDRLVAGRVVRLGAYGDPAALPLDVVRHIVGPSTAHTGYTHQWQSCPQELRHLVMASVDSSEEYHRAIAGGWRTFRIRTDEPIARTEIACPASAERGHKTTCVSCTLCDGVRSSDKRKSVTILAHGTGRRYIPLVAA